MSKPFLLLSLGVLLAIYIAHDKIAAATTPLVGVTQVRAGEGYALALRHDGAVFAWGGNASGTLGNGSTDPSLLPALVSGLGPDSGVRTLVPSAVFALALKTDGTVLGWGANSLGQLGDGTFDNRLTPVTSTLGNVEAIAAGLSHAVALKTDGSVWAWGSNNMSNLGNPSVTGSRNVPVPVAGLAAGSGVVAIAAGGNFTLALKSDGTVLGWGNNNNGQLGIGSTVTPQPTPVAVKGPGGVGLLSNIVEIAAPPSAGGAFALARHADGTVWAWGNNANGQLGDGTTTPKTTPVRVKGIGGVGVLGNVASIAAAGGTNNMHATAGLADGTVVAWGSNANGQLGTGNNASSNVPVVVTGLVSGPAVTSVAAALGLSMALRSDASVVAWGDNNSGQLGDGTYFGRPTPAAVVNAAGIESISTQVTSNHSLALRADNTVLAWGNNDNGQLGTGNTANQSLPFLVPNLVDVTAAAVGASHSLVLRADGSVWAWGDNSNGQLGIGNALDQLNPVQVLTTGTTTLQNVAEIAAGGNASYARTVAGDVYAWGINNVGQLGINSTTNQSFAVPVHGVGNVGFLGGITAIATNGSVGYALRSDGAVLAWGQNAAGQVGDGTTTPTPRTTPVQVAGLGPGSGVVRVSAIAGGGAVLKADGSVLAWGLNGSGQVGDGTTTSRNAPVLVTGLGTGSDVSAFAGGGGIGQGQTLAVRSDGTLLSWGTNGSGQLGDGTLAAHFVPMPAGIGGIKEAAGGSLHTLALTTGGTLLAWGANGSGQLGDGTVYTKNLAPAPVLFDDVTPPVIPSVQLTPSIVGAAGQVTVTNTVADADSGIALVTASVSGPSPSTTEVGSVDLTRQSGTAFSGEWSGTFTFPLQSADGTFTIGGTATDAAGNDITTTYGTVLLDRTPPSASMTVSNTSIWPPNGRPTPVTVSGTALDAGSGVAAVTYTVTDEYGRVQPAGTVQPDPSGSFSVTVQLEAFREEEDRNGRVYVVVVQVQDQAGNVSSASATVTVLHNLK